MMKSKGLEVSLWITLYHSGKDWKLWGEWQMWRTFIWVQLRRSLWMRTMKNLSSHDLNTSFTWWAIILIYVEINGFLLVLQFMTFWFYSLVWWTPSTSFLHAVYLFLLCHLLLLFLLPTARKRKFGFKRRWRRDVLYLVGTNDVDNFLALLVGVIRLITKLTNYTSWQYECVACNMNCQHILLPDYKFLDGIQKQGYFGVVSFI